MISILRFKWWLWKSLVMSRRLLWIPEKYFNFCRLSYEELQWLNELDGLK